MRTPIERLGSPRVHHPAAHVDVLGHRRPGVPQLVGDRPRGQPRLVDAAIDQMNRRWPAAAQALIVRL